MISMYATINRDTLQLVALDSRAPKLVEEPCVVIDTEALDDHGCAYKQFDRLRFSFLELLVLYRNISNAKGFVTSFRDSLISYIVRHITHGEPLTQHSATLWDDPAAAHSARTAHANDRPAVTTPPSAPKRTSAPRTSTPRDSEPLETRNGITRYRPGTGGGNTWDYFDAHPATDRSELAQVAADNGWAEASVRKVFANWKKFHAVST